VKALVAGSVAAFPAKSAKQYSRPRLSPPKSSARSFCRSQLDSINSFSTSNTRSAFDGDMFCLIIRDGNDKQLGRFRFFGMRCALRCKSNRRASISRLGEPIRESPLFDAGLPVLI
jgi:hypothetical protein